VVEWIGSFEVLGAILAFWKVLGFIWNSRKFGGLLCKSRVQKVFW
jgi:hypothetical protein